MAMTVLAEENQYLDKFIPVHCIPELLKIAGTMKHFNEKSALSPQNDLAEKFMQASHKNQDLFNPLTRAIFWNIDVKQSIQENTQLINSVDNYHHTPLNLAIANEDFKTAASLIEQGAKITLEDKTLLEISFTSLIQRDKSFIANMLKQVSPENSFWIGGYLQFLNEHITGDKSDATKKFRDIFDPPIKHFGMPLHLNAHVDGILSLYGFLSPTLEMIKAHLHIYIEYAQQEQDIQDIFCKILSGFDKSIQCCRYVANIPLRDNASQKLAERFAKNYKEQNSEITYIPSGWAGNSICISLIDDKLIYTNLGIGGDPEYASKIFKIKNPNNIDANLINTLLSGLGNAYLPQYILSILSSIVEPTPIYAISQNLRPLDNCTFSSPCYHIEAVLLMLLCNKNALTLPIKKNKELEHKQLLTKKNNVFKDYIAKLHNHTINTLITSIKNTKLSRQYRQECCLIALSYINQHNMNNSYSNINLNIELKNALEYAGLGSLYNYYAAEHSKENILEEIIKSQELTAVHTLKQEKELLKLNYQTLLNQRKIKLEKFLAIQKAKKNKKEQQ